MMSMIKLLKLSSGAFDITPFETVKADMWTQLGAVIAAREVVFTDNPPTEAAHFHHLFEDTLPLRHLQGDQVVIRQTTLAAALSETLASVQVAPAALAAP